MAVTLDTSLYNSRIVGNYVEYLTQHYPGLDVNAMLEYAGMKRYEVEDPACWFTQEQVDRFQEIMATQTGNPRLPREVGRFGAISKASSSVKKLVLGFMNPYTAYRLLEKTVPLFSRSTVVRVKRLGKNKVEVTAINRPGTTERPFQCENRMGMLEAMGKLFTNRFAMVEHPECLHERGGACRYVVTWERSPSFTWMLASRYAALGTLGIAFFCFFLLPRGGWALLTISCAVVAIGFFLYAQWLEKREMARMIAMQGDVAKERLEEINLRYNHARLVQEIGRATSTVLDVDELMKTVAEAMDKHLGFDRGVLLLAEESSSRLVFKAGYGYTEEQYEVLKTTRFITDDASSTGLFVVAFREQRSFLLNDISKNPEGLLGRSVEFAKQMGAQSLICVPIVYERKSFGLLVVDNIHSKRPLTQTDLSLLTGLAYQLAMSLVNAQSFKRLQESEKNYRELVESANSIIVRLDKSGNIVFFNEFAQEFFGYGNGEVLGCNMVGTLMEGGQKGQRDLDILMGDVKLRPGRHITHEMEHLKRSGEKVWVAWTRKAILDEKGDVEGVLCIGNDVTQLRTAAEEKRQLALRLQRAQKMEAIGTLAGGVAHDLNNILSGLVSYPELLLMELPPESPLIRPLMTIKKSGERAAGIVQDLLTLARRGVNTVEVVEVNRVIRDYLQSPEHLALKLEHPDVVVETFLAKDLFQIEGSPLHLSKTVTNLVKNAVEAMPVGGRILISTENRYVDRPIRGYDDVEEGDHVVLTVSDTGVGIPQKDLERIFEPFYTKKVMGRSGTGLGLSVVWGTVKDHHGYIDVRSVEGEGTTCTLYFPVTKREIPEELPPRVMEEDMGKGESILVVDDVAEQREIASRLLEKLGYTVAVASSGEAAVEYLKRQSVDVLLLDMIMEPGMDGLDTYKKILELHPGQRAVIVSGYSETGRVLEAQRLGVGSYVRKPYAMDTIGAAVRKELDR